MHVFGKKHTINSSSGSPNRANYYAQITLRFNFRGYNFKKFPGVAISRPPKMACLACYCASNTRVLPSYNIISYIGPHILSFPRALNSFGSPANKAGKHYVKAVQRLSYIVPYQLTIYIYIYIYIYAKE